MTGSNFAEADDVGDQCCAPLLIVRGRARVGDCGIMILFAHGKEPTDA